MLRLLLWLSLALLCCRPAPAQAVSAGVTDAPDWDSDGLVGVEDRDPLVANLCDIVAWELDGPPEFAFDLDPQQLSVEYRAAAAALGPPYVLRHLAVPAAPSLPALLPSGAANARRQSLSLHELVAQAAAETGVPAVLLLPSHTSAIPMLTTPILGADVSRERLREFEFIRHWRAAVSNPRFRFTVVFYNSAAAALDCDGVGIPVCHRGQILAYALPVDTPEGGTAFTVPPSTAGPTRLRFELQFSYPVFLDLITAVDAEHGFDVDLAAMKGTMRLRDSGVDQLALRRERPMSCLRVLVESPDGTTLTWLLTRTVCGPTPQSGHRITAAEVILALNQRVARQTASSQPLFRVSPEGILVSALGFDENSRRHWVLDVDGRTEPAQRMDAMAILADRLTIRCRDLVQEAEARQRDGPTPAARQLWEALAARGDLCGVGRLGLYRVHGWAGVPADVLAGLRQILTAAEGGDAAAANVLGVLLAVGDNMKPNPEKARQWLQAAADQGYAPAWFNLGWIYWQGLAVKPDAQQALSCLARAADAGLPQADLALGRYALTSASPPDYATAWEHYRRAAAAGLAEAEFRLACLFLSGRGTTADPVEADRWLNAAAEHGSPQARRLLGLLACQATRTPMPSNHGLALLEASARDAGNSMSALLEVLGADAGQSVSDPDPKPLLFW